MFFSGVGTAGNSAWAQIDVLIQLNRIFSRMSVSIRPVVSVHSRADRTDRTQTEWLRGPPAP